MRRIRSRLTYANVMATLAVFIALGGTALASVIITSNSQVAQDTISGHKPPSGRHSNLISGSVNGKDLAKPLFHSAGLANDHSGGCGSVTNQWASLNDLGRVGYYRDLQGRVYLQGFAEQCGVPGGPILTLPAGFRPVQSLNRFVILRSNDNTPVALYIDSFGDVGPANSSGGNQFSLQDVSFRCGPSGQNGCP